MVAILNIKKYNPMVTIINMENNPMVTIIYIKNKSMGCEGFNKFNRFVDTIKRIC